MSNQLSEQILSCLESSGLADFDQRSALGLAYNWTKDRKPFVPPVHSSYQKRDALASQIIQLLEGSPDEEHGEALAEARRVLNEPYRRGDFVGTAKVKEFKRPRNEGSNGKES